MKINDIEIEVERKPIKHIHLAVYPPNGCICLFDQTASSNTDDDAPIAPHAPTITYEPPTSYPQSLAAEPTIQE